MFLVRIYSAICIFISLVFFSLLPYCGLSVGARTKRGAFIISLANCVACGIFLSTCFLGVIPHVQMQEMSLRADYAKWNGTGDSGVNLPSFLLNTQLVVLAGFVLILIIEQSIFACSSSGHSHSHSHLPSSEVDSHRLQSLGPSGGSMGRRSEEAEALVQALDEEDEDDDLEEIIFRKEETVVLGEEVPGGHGHSHALPLAQGLSLRTLFLLLGLSIHSLFEGLALGLQRDSADFTKLLIAIMLHEVLCCLAYGVSLAQQRAPRGAAFISVCILSACIPVGVIAALLIDSFDGSMTTSIRFLLEGLAAGTFVYVACVEMLSMELNNLHGRGGVAAAFAVAAGVVLFALLQNSVHHESPPSAHSSLR